MLIIEFCPEGRPAIWLHSSLVKFVHDVRVDMRYVGTV